MERAAPPPASGASPTNSAGCLTHVKRVVYLLSVSGRCVSPLLVVLAFGVSVRFQLQLPVPLPSPLALLSPPLTAPPQVTSPTSILP